MRAHSCNTDQSYVHYQVTMDTSVLYTPTILRKRELLGPRECTSSNIFRAVMFMASKGLLCNSKAQNKNKEMTVSENLPGRKHSPSTAPTVLSSESLQVWNWDGGSQGNLLSVIAAQWALTA